LIRDRCPDGRVACESTPLPGYRRIDSHAACAQTGRRDDDLHAAPVLPVDQS
jgi:hypothetical protein